MSILNFLFTYSTSLFITEFYGKCLVFINRINYHIFFYYILSIWQLVPAFKYFSFCWWIFRNFNFIPIIISIAINCSVYAVNKCNYILYWCIYSDNCHIIVYLRCVSTPTNKKISFFSRTLWYDCVLSIWYRLSGKYLSIIIYIFYSIFCFWSFKHIYINQSCRTFHSKTYCIIPT